jgi:hypothetical protein
MDKEQPCSLPYTYQMPGGSRYVPPRSWSTVLLEAMLVVLVIVLIGALVSRFL